MKSYTDLEQSKRLAEILPIESADMRFCFSHRLDGRIKGHYPMIGREPSLGTIPCWSLAALLDVLRNVAHNIDEDASVILYSYKNVEWGLSMNYTNIGLIYNSNHIDVCYEMVLKLHELNLL